MVFISEFLEPGPVPDAQHLLNKAFIRDFHGEVWGDILRVHTAGPGE